MTGATEPDPDVALELDPAVEAEFGAVAGWTEEAVLDLGPDYATPAGCRGSGSPSALTWLAGSLEVTAGTPLLDVGAGVGGPAAFAAEQFSVRPLLVEPMLAACHAAGRLFGLPVVNGDARALPIADASFPVAWCLGVLCTMSEQATAVAELRRILVPGGRLGPLVFIRTVTSLPEQPTGNHFPSTDELRVLLDQVELRVDASAMATDLAPAAPGWREREEAVQSYIGARHGTSDAWRMAERQAAIIRRLLAEGLVQGQLIAATRM